MFISERLLNLGAHNNLTEIRTPVICRVGILLLVFVLSVSLQFPLFYLSFFYFLQVLCSGTYFFADKLLIPFSNLFIFPSHQSSSIIVLISSSLAKYLAFTFWSLLQQRKQTIIKLLLPPTSASCSDCSMPLCSGILNLSINPPFQFPVL